MGFEDRRETTSDREESVTEGRLRDGLTRERMVEETSPYRTVHPDAILLATDNMRIMDLNTKSKEAIIDSGPRVRRSLLWETSGSDSEFNKFIQMSLLQAKSMLLYFRVSVFNVKYFIIKYQEYEFLYCVKDGTIADEILDYNEDRLVCELWRHQQSLANSRSEYYYLPIYFKSFSCQPITTQTFDYELLLRLIGYSTYVHTQQLEAKDDRNLKSSTQENVTTFPGALTSFSITTIPPQDITSINTRTTTRENQLERESGVDAAMEVVNTQGQNSRGSRKLDDQDTTTENSQTEFVKEIDRSNEDPFEDISITEQQILVGDLYTTTVKTEHSMDKNYDSDSSGNSGGNPTITNARRNRKLKQNKRRKNSDQLLREFRQLTDSMYNIVSQMVNGEVGYVDEIDQDDYDYYDDVTKDRSSRVNIKRKRKPIVKKAYFYHQLSMIIDSIYRERQFIKELNENGTELEYTYSKMNCREKNEFDFLLVMFYLTNGFSPPYEIDSSEIITTNHCMSEADIKEENSILIKRGKRNIKPLETALLFNKINGIDKTKKSRRSVRNVEWEKKIETWRSGNSLSNLLNISKLNWEQGLCGDIISRVEKGLFNKKIDSVFDSWEDSSGPLKSGKLKVKDNLTKQPNFPELNSEYHQFESLKLRTLLSEQVVEHEYDSMQWGGLDIQHTCHTGSWPDCNFNNLAESMDDDFSRLNETSTHLSKNFLERRLELGSKGKSAILSVLPLSNAGMVDFTIQGSGIELKSKEVNAELKSFKITSCEGCYGCNSGFVCNAQIVLEGIDTLTIHFMARSPFVVLDHGGYNLKGNKQRTVYQKEETRKLSNAEESSKHHNSLDNGFNRFEIKGAGILETNNVTICVEESLDRNLGLFKSEICSDINFRLSEPKHKLIKRHEVVNVKGNSDDEKCTGFKIASCMLRNVGSFFINVYNWLVHGLGYIKYLIVFVITLLTASLLVWIIVRVILFCKGKHVNSKVIPIKKIKTLIEKKTKALPVSIRDKTINDEIMKFASGNFRKLE